MSFTLEFPMNTAINQHPKENVLMIGNSHPNDYLGAINAGLQALHVDRKNEGLTENCITDLRVLPRLLGKP